MASPLDTLEPYDGCGPVGSIIAYALITLPITIPFLFALQRFLAAHLRAREAERLEREPLRVEGGPGVFAGTVETDDDAPAVRVVIEEQGREVRTNRGTTSIWTEISRAVQARPFRLRLPDDRAIDVRPDERIRLISKLVTERFEDNSRARVVCLSPGEKVWIRGVLDVSGSEKLGAYRASPSAAVLTGSPSEPLEASVWTLGARRSRWRAFHRSAVVLLGAFFLLTHTLFVGKFNAEWLSGRVVSAHIVDLHSRVVDTKSGPVTLHEVDARLPAAYGVEVHGESVPVAVHDLVKSGEVREIPYLVVPWAPFIHVIGTRPQVALVWAILGSVLNFFVLAFYIHVYVRSRPFYEQPKVVEEHAGPLPEGAYLAQVPEGPSQYVDERPRTDSLTK